MIRPTNLKIKLLKAGLKQCDAAEDLGLSEGHLSRQLNGRIAIPKELSIQLKTWIQVKTIKNKKI